MLDTRLEGRDRGLEYANDMVYLPQTNADEPRKPDVDAFRANLQDPTRTLLGAKQERWLIDSVERSTRRGAIWQVLGQQVLMANVGIPKISESALAEGDMSEQRKKYTAFLQALARAGDAVEFGCLGRLSRESGSHRTDACGQKCQYGCPRWGHA